MIDKANCPPIMVRLAWHDSGTYDMNIPLSEFPKCGGANGSIRFSPEIDHGANAGLSLALKLLEPIKKQFPTVGWADLMQMASAAAIELTGGPKIDMKYGRVDATGPEDCHPEGNLPAAEPPFPNGEANPQTHLRKVFHRMGFNDQEIVALSGAHSLGRAFPDRSGANKKDSTKYTDGSTNPRWDGKAGVGRKGGQSWTEKWLKFGNDYFHAVVGDDDDLLKLSTDSSLFMDEAMMPFARKYKEDEAAFFADYAKAHKKLAELGSKFEPAEGITGV
jgi:L-ascorbate peroxidase